eukprot:CAMPEP_0195593590 /NCGR_PEP_ID=MMETSP0815-20121206/969_1 /TAXON_ID=97485 /ORGANISM="Prymnesium parvum, Strain Texoma1" /LENGTH=125 /DNA_ID=CAMNT_0040732747 /DNA_START=230 /DNA_END=604 /DNA_ORIENTATION=-
MAHENAALHVVPWCEARRPACLHDGPCCNELLVLSLQASSADTWTILNCSAFSAACDLLGGEWAGDERPPFLEDTWTILNCSAFSAACDQYACTLHFRELPNSRILPCLPEPVRPPTCWEGSGRG